MNPVYFRRIDPTEPLVDGTSMLRAAHGVIAATAPVVRALGSRMARRFRRAAPEVAPVSVSQVSRSFSDRHGASRYYSRDMGRQFTAQAGRSVAPVPRRDLTLASRLLMSGTLPRHRRPAHTPQADLMTVLQNRSRAFAQIGTLSHRFSQNMLDMRDGRADMARTFRQQARVGKPQPDNTLNYAYV